MPITFNEFIGPILDVAGLDISDITDRLSKSGFTAGSNATLNVMNTARLLKNSNASSAKSSAILEAWETMPEYVEDQPDLSAAEDDVRQEEVATATYRLATEFGYVVDGGVNPDKVGQEEEFKLAQYGSRTLSMQCRCLRIPSTGYYHISIQQGALTATIAIPPSALGVYSFVAVTCTDEQYAVQLSEGYVSIANACDYYDSCASTTQCMREILGSATVAGKVSAARIQSILDKYPANEVLGEVSDAVSRSDEFDARSVLAIIARAFDGAGYEYSSGDDHYVPLQQPGFASDILGTVFSAIGVVIAVVLAAVFQAIGAIITMVVNIVSSVLSWLKTNVSLTQSTVDHVSDIPTWNFMTDPVDVSIANHPMRAEILEAFNEYGLSALVRQFMGGAGQQERDTTCMILLYPKFQEDGSVSEDTCTAQIAISADIYSNRYTPVSPNWTDQDETNSLGLTLTGPSLGQGSEAMAPVENTGLEYATASDATRRISANVALSNFLLGWGFNVRGNFSTSFFNPKKFSYPMSSCIHAAELLMQYATTGTTLTTEEIAATIGYQMWIDPSYFGWDGLTTLMRWSFWTEDFSSDSGVSFPCLISAALSSGYFNTVIPGNDLYNANCIWPTLSKRSLIATVAVTALLATATFITVKTVQRSLRNKASVRIAKREQEWNAAKADLEANPNSSIAKKRFAKANRKLDRAWKKAGKAGLSSYNGFSCDTSPSVTDSAAAANAIISPPSNVVDQSTVDPGFLNSLAYSITGANLV